MPLIIAPRALRFKSGNHNALTLKLRPSAIQKMQVVLDLLSAMIIFYLSNDHLTTVKAGQWIAIKLGTPNQTTI